jgi:hypothetical protein
MASVSIEFCTIFPLPLPPPRRAIHGRASRASRVRGFTGLEQKEPMEVRKRGVFILRQMVHMVDIWCFYGGWKGG